MLYTLFEMQHAAMAPVRLAIQQSYQFYKSPVNPLSHTPFGRVMAASFDMIEQATRRYGKPEFGLDTTEIKGKKVPITEKVEARKTFGQLRHFCREGLEKDPKLLIVAPMSGHFATLLRGTVETMLPDHNVYITDWRDARAVPVSEGSFDLDDYIDYLIDWLAYLGPNTHVMAVCQPSVPVYGAVTLMDQMGHKATPASVTFMGGPIDTRCNPTEVNSVATTKPIEWFEENVITVVPLPNPGVMRKVYPGFLQLVGFMTMNLGNHVMKYQELFQHLIVGDGESAERTKAFYDEYRSVADMTAEFYLQTIEVVFQKHLLPKGEWVSRGRPIKPENWTSAALLAVEGELDDISGVGQTKAALDISIHLDDDKKQYLLAPKVGHYGIFNGRRWRDDIAPVVKAFIAKHDASTKTSPAKPTPAKTAPVKTAPVKTAPAKPAPVKTTPVKNTAAKTAPAKPAPVKTAPVKTTPVKNTAAKTAPAKPAPKRT